VETTITIAWTFGLLMVATTTFCPLLKKQYAFMLGGLLYALVDVITGMMGIWTLMCFIAWGIVGLTFTYFKPTANPINFLGMSFVGTLLFDLLTGVIGGPLLFPMSFADAFIGQIPFTISHLIGNTVVVGVLSPLLFVYIGVNTWFKENMARIGVYSPEIAT